MQGMINIGSSSTLKCGNPTPGNGQNMTVNGKGIVGMHHRIFAGGENTPKRGTTGTSGTEMSETMAKTAV